MNSLGARLLVAAGVLLLAFVLLTGWALNRADAERAQQALQDRLQGLIYGILGAAEPDKQGRLVISDLQLPDPRLRQTNSGLYALLSDAEGKIIWRSPSLLSPPGPIPSLSEGQLRLRPLEARGAALDFGLTWEAKGGAQNYTLTVVEAGGTDVRQVLRFERTLWTILLLAALLLLLLLLSVLRWGLTPLRRLTHEIRALRDGGRTALSTNLPQELQPLAGAVNELLENERARLEQQRHALDNLAHSLKTPLAVLRAQGAQGEPVERMQQLVDYHLQRAATGASASFAPPLLIAPLAEQMINALRKVHADRSLKFDLYVPPDCRLRMEQGECMELLGNLLDNAARWARGKVALIANTNPQSVDLWVDDDGPGFPAEAEQLLERGVRGTAASASGSERADQRVGHGIGLAVVQDIVRARHGVLELTRAPLGGARVHIRLPFIKKAARN